MKTKDTVRNRNNNINNVSTLLKKDEKNKISWIYYMPLLLIAGSVPLIVYGKYVDLTGTTQALFWTGQNQLLDFFSYWKSRWVIFLTAIALITYIFLLITKKLPFKKEYKYYIPLGIYTFLAILSTIFAIDVPTALHGFIDMYQGMWVLLSYVTITFLVLNYVNGERDVKLFLFAFIILIIVEGLIGVGQYFGFDIFNTKFGNHLIIPSGVKVDGGINFNFGKHTIYGTLFNTNFVGSFATLMLPIVVVFVIYSKGIQLRILSIISFLLCTFTWIGCNSRAGYIGVVASIFCSIILLRKYLFKQWKITISIFMIGIIGLGVLNYASDNGLINQISRLNIINELNEIKKLNRTNDIFKLKDIDINGNYVSIKTSHQNINIKVVGDKLHFLDNSGNTLNIKTTDDGYLVVENLEHPYLNLKVATQYPGFTVTAPYMSNMKLNFYISDGVIKMISNGGRLMIPAKTSNYFVGLEKFASGRGFIWGKTIPLLKNYFFIGSGPDNYTMAFPQDDFVAKLNFGMEALTVIDKPHNMYLQMAVNTGVLSLITMLLIWSIYLFDSFKLYWDIKFDSLDKRMGVACMLSIVGYLVSGIFNDQIVSVAPLFWIILGIGISINCKLKRSI